MANITSATTATTSDTTSSTSSNDDCPLNRLPVELRTYIFELAIAKAEPIEISFEAAPGGQYTPDLRDLATYIHITGFQLAQTCRQFRAEVLPLFCAVNSIALELPPDRELPAASVPAFLSKTPHLIINVWDLERATGCVHYDAGKIHIKQRAGRIVEVSDSGTLEGRCLCEIQELAESFKGKDCVREFVRKFEEKEFRYFFNFSSGMTERKKLVCEKCGKAETPPVLSKRDS